MIYSGGITLSWSTCIQLFADLDLKTAQTWCRARHISDWMCEGWSWMVLGISSWDSHRGTSTINKSNTSTSFRANTLHSTNCSGTAQPNKQTANILKSLNNHSKESTNPPITETILYPCQWNLWPPCPPSSFPALQQCAGLSFQFPCHTMRTCWNLLVWEVHLSCRQIHCTEAANVVQHEKNQWQASQPTRAKWQLSPWLWRSVNSRKLAASKVLIPQLITRASSCAILWD